MEDRFSGFHVSLERAPSLNRTAAQRRWGGGEHQGVDERLVKELGKIAPYVRKKEPFVWGRGEKDSFLLSFSEEGAVKRGVRLSTNNTSLREVIRRRM